jgi:hypothetical protein
MVRIAVTVGIVRTSHAQVMYRPGQSRSPSTECRVDIAELSKLPPCGKRFNCAGGL